MAQLPERRRPEAPRRAARLHLETRSCMTSHNFAVDSRLFSHPPAEDDECRLHRQLQKRRIAKKNFARKPPHQFSRKPAEPRPPSAKPWIFSRRSQHIYWGFSCRPPNLTPPAAIQLAPTISETLSPHIIL